MSAVISTGKGTTPRAVQAATRATPLALSAALLEYSKEDTAFQSCWSIHEQWSPFSVRWERWRILSIEALHVVKGVVT